MQGKGPRKALSGEGKDGFGWGKRHASGWKYRKYKYTWSRTRLRNKPTLIESVHRDLGQRGRDQVRPGHTPVLAKAPGLFRGFRQGPGGSTEAGSELLL